jgi:hypothetical protein
MAFPVIMNSVTRLDYGSHTREGDSGVRHDQQPTSGTTAR